MPVHKTETLITCGVFRPLLDYLRVRPRYPHVRFRVLPSSLHINPYLLELRIRKEMDAALRRGEKIACLYGECFPGIKECCQEYGAARAHGSSCYEMLLGSERFRQILEESAGTYFLEKDLIVDFEKYCAEPLELYDEEMRKELFKHYKKLVYVRQPTDPDLLSRVEELAGFLELALDILDSDYSPLERQLMALIQSEPLAE